MAIFRKKSQTGGGESAKDEFTPQPDKARKWFNHAKTMADSFNFAAALNYYANGIKLDPQVQSAHEAMYEVAIKYMNKGGKAASSKEVKAIDGPDAVSKFAAAEFAWMKDLNNATLAVKALDAAARAGAFEYGNWIARKVLALLRRSKKPSKSLLTQAMGLFRDVSAWNEAIETGEMVMRLDPTDGVLAAEIKNLSAQRAMDQGGYDRAGSEASGGFRGSVKDMDKQRELVEAEAITVSKSTEERNLERARAAYDENPTAPETIAKYAQLLRKHGTPEAEQAAHDVYMRGFEETNEYRFRMSAGDIRVEQARRAVAALEQRLGQTGANRSNHEPDAALADELRKAQGRLADLQAAEYRERAEKYPTDRQLRYRLGEVEFALGNTDEAMACFQAAKDEPKLRVRAGHLLGRCFAVEGWHSEAIDEFKDALDAIDATERDREFAIRYDLMISLLEHARAEKSVEHARDAKEICSGIARKDITYRDIRDRRKEVDELIKSLG